MNIAVAPGPVKTFTPLLSALFNIDQHEYRKAVTIASEARNAKRGFYFIGNGGSAAIASHMAADWLKTLEVPAYCFNDGALTTCMANDLGYGNVFSFPLSIHAGRGDVLFAISSSGKSESITNAVQAAHDCGMKVITLSGFAHDNPLRSMGDANFHVGSFKYGLVEVAHHAICHSILDEVAS